MNYQEQHPKLKNPNLNKFKIDYVLQNPKNNNNKTKDTNRTNQIKITKNRIKNMRDESMEDTSDCCREGAKLESQQKVDENFQAERGRKGEILVFICLLQKSIKVQHVLKSTKVIEF